MSTATLTAPVQSSSATRGLTEAYYTICPVLTASNVAVELGWLEDEFRRVHAKPVYLRSLPGNAGWLPHYTHALHPLIRDGGSIPTIQVHADLEDTTLVALTGNQSGGQIVTRAGTGIHRVADLRGRKIGLFHSLNKGKIDFSRATAERGILLALELAGLKRQEVEIVDLEDADDPSFLQPASKPSGLWSQLRDERVGFNGLGKDAQALRDGRIDAIYANHGRSHTLVRTGEFTVIEDLSRYPDWTLQIANGPSTNAVSTSLAKEHPEIVIAFLRASIRAGRWINANREAAADIFKRVTFFTCSRQILKAIRDIDFVPNLSPQNLAATTLQKNFLRDHGYLKNDFDVKDWANSAFLEEALRGL
ncbi:nitrate ABC transporter substrate-binding protein [Opitutaceae bacterium TAV5]|nr:nitrate ABC transporter substrate-binding protein [Opitutaceae bacterium TAV5]